MGARAKLGISAPYDINQVEREAGGAGFHFAVQRSYWSNMPGSYVIPETTDDQSKGRLSVVSVKPGDWSDAAGIAAKFKTFLRTIPQSAHARVIVQHEPEDNCSDLPNGGQQQHLGTISEWKRMQDACGQAVRDVNAGRTNKILWVVNFMSWSVGNGNCQRLWTDNAGWHVAAFDGYSWDGRPERAAADIFADNVAFAQSKHVGFAINETGIGVTFDHRGAWTRALWTWCLDPANPVRWACYWDSSTQFQLTHTAEVDSLAWRP